jgi:chemotaxis protein CheX
MTSLHADIASIAQTIWQALFESTIAIGGDGGLGAESQVTGLVQLSGTFQGAVMIQCPEALGSELTAAMLQGAQTPGAGDMVDALGELTNMFAGNIKALLPKPSSISLPTVALGSHYEIDVVGTTVLARVPFLCDGHPLVVTVLEGQPRNENEARRAGEYDDTGQPPTGPEARGALR